MNVYPPIIDAHSLVQLKKDVEYFNPSRNHWIGINDEPENTIERYIQDSFDFYLADNFSSTIFKGFEWWLQVFTGDDGIPFHDNHDENLRIETGEKRYH